MTVTPIPPTPEKPARKIRWQALPPDFKLDDKPVENTGQPLLAGALRESLELSDRIKPEMLVASNFGLCATVDEQFIAKAPDWVYVASVLPRETPEDRKSYTPHLEGEIPTLVLEFLSDLNGEEYSVRQLFPPGKWFFYEQILQIPYYGIFEPVAGALEFYHLENGRYKLIQPDENGRNWIPEMKLFIGAWRGTKEERTGYWLRWWDEAGNMLPWAVERLQEAESALSEERQRAEAERQRAEQERQEKERLLEYLRSRGIDPEQLP
ncbi:Uma2 family endonuclease [Oscillatoria sp. FACHB-1406]|uniref:Uma2 family endonuclease n=1 Tax=Oscillatoria sp. FACHB-1406 TaxID=2692846 RepID=UPI00168296A3|nr:Uma2 family endonuclease [Oscillatoria sp. FACHB-1406]MBD2580541.1 Uma2 family endonuclease [Oscillatoria sp. FACHB-1406]